MSYKANSNIIKVSTAGVVGANGLIVGNPDTTAKDASAALEIESTTGWLLLPRVTTVQRDAIASPTQGLLVENTTTDRAEVKAFSGWQRVMTEETAAITTSQIVNSAVTTNKINDLAVTTNKINNSAITNEKLAPLNYAVSASSGFFVAIGPTIVDVPNFSLTITTTGRPVEISILPAGSTETDAGFLVNTTGNYAIIYLLRNGSTIRATKFSGGNGNWDSQSGINFIDFPPAGTHTYKIQTRGSGVGADSAVYNCFLFCCEK